MAENTEGLFDQAKEMIQGTVGNPSEMLAKAKEMLGDKATDASALVAKAKELFGDKVGDVNVLLEKAKAFVGDKADDFVKNSDELKAKATEIGKKLTPDQFDDKVEGIVDSAVDFITDKLGGKKA